MATETERKFLVTGTGWRSDVERSSAVVQGYLARSGRLSIRVRVVDDAEALLTIKSAEPGIDRREFEYPLPVDEARQLMKLCSGHVIEKRRHIVPFGGFRWEVDVFGGVHDGLVLAEVELPGAGTPIERPGWLGDEVTGDPRYYNDQLAAKSTA